MTRDEVRKFANLVELPALHAQLLGILQQHTMETARLLNHHGGELANLLKYAQPANDSSGTQSGSNGQADDSSSSSDDSDSSDSDSD